MRSNAGKHCSTVAYSVPITRSSSAAVERRHGELAARNTASSTPIEKWAPTRRSLRRSRCSYSSAAFSSGAGITYVS